MKTLVRALVLCVIVASLSLVGCEMFGGGAEAPEGAGQMPGYSAQFKPGGCCETAVKAGEACAHPCCVTAAAAGKLCEKCNPT
ncbi:MAG: hypothetical protein O7J95_13215 [Planctomycetota bacterium]|nr:hypothetical protein [Planctomycetota bacterium]